jgi:hypothetical protein
MMVARRDKLDNALNEYCRDVERQAARKTIQELSIVVGWLTMQPDTKRQAEVRKWVENKIAAIEKTLTDEGRR